MKKYFNIWFVLMGLVFNLSGQSLYVLDNLDHGVTALNLPNGSGFQLDFTFDMPSPDCDMAQVTMNLPVGVVFVSIYHDNYNIITNTSSEIVIEVAVTGAESIQFNMGLFKDGKLCEGDPIVMNVSTQYFDNGNQCGAPIVSNDVTLVPQFTKDYALEMSLYNQGSTCIGGYTKIKLLVKGVPGNGGFELNDIEFSTEVNGTNIIIQDEFGNQLTHNATPNGCLNTVTWSYPSFPLGNYGWSRDFTFYLIKENECNCFSSPAPDFLDVSISGLDPCGSLYTFSHSFDYVLEEDCCVSGSPFVPGVSKQMFLNNGIQQFCSGSCELYNYSYLLSYSNANNSYDVQGLTISDAIPVGVILTRLTVSAMSGIYPTTMCYTTNQNPESCVPLTTIGSYNLINFSLGSNGPSNIQLGPNEYVTNISFIYNNPIPAWSPHQQKIFLYFYVDDGYIQLDDNIGTFSTNSPTWSESVIYNHPPSPACKADYNIRLWVYDTFYNDFRNNTQAFPQDVVRVSIVVTNNGVGLSPDADITLQLPDGIEYLGNETYDYTNWSFNAQVVNVIPADLSISYDLVDNIVNFNDLEVPPVCNTVPTESAILQFDLRVKEGTLASVKTLFARVNDEHFNSARIYVNDKYIAKAQVYQRCSDGEFYPVESNITANEEIELVYELYNAGNVPISDIQFAINKIEAGDITLGSGLARNSEFDLSFSSNPSALNAESFNFAFVDIAPSDYCNLNLNLQTGDEYLLIKQSNNASLFPGEKFQISQKYLIDGPVNIGEIGISDFQFCCLRGDINTHDQEPSEQHQLQVSDTGVCPELIECDLEEHFLDRLLDPFNFIISNNNITISSSGLTSNDSWYPIWGDDSYGGQGLIWGNGDYTHSYSEVGEYEICIYVENHIIANDPLSETCHCKILCETISLGEMQDQCCPNTFPQLSTEDNDLALILNGSNESLDPGDDLTLTINIFNQGQSQIDEIELAMYLGNCLSYDLASGQGWQVYGNQIRKTINVSLSPNQSAQEQINLEVPLNAMTSNCTVYAEIVNMWSMGIRLNDVDSTPDCCDQNDLGAVAGSFTDDNISGPSNIDEDDHDVHIVNINQN